MPRRAHRWAVVVALLAVVAAACGPAGADGGGAAGDDAEAVGAGGETGTGGVDTDGAAGGDTSAASPSEVAGVDLSRHSVPLDDIHFDTFDGGSIPLSQASAQLIEGLRDRIPPLTDPPYGDPATGDWMEADDLVLGYVTADGVPYAYPHKILNFHEIVNDEFAGVPVLVSYCPLCRSGVVYDRRLNGRELTFGNTSALYENDLVMVDNETDTFWWQVPGRAIVGELTGETLEPLPSSTMPWERWRSVHPDTRVLSRDLGFGIDYTRDPFLGYADRVDDRQLPFPVDEESLNDDRLTPGTRVLGVEVGDEARAYPLADLRGSAVNDELGGTSIVVFVGPDGGGAAFRATVDGRELEFRRASEAFVDDETGTRWDLAGRAVDGPLEGTTLEAVPSRSTFWFAYIGSFPDATVHQPTG